MVEQVNQGDRIDSFFQSNNRQLLPAKIHCCFYDQTHDNPCQIQRHSLADLLPRSACVAMSNCSIGSTRGYDEVIPHYIDVVKETRFYATWDRQINQTTGIIAVKNIFNNIHVELNRQGFHQVRTQSIFFFQRIVLRFR